MDRVVQAATEAYNVYAFHKVYHAVHNFCAVELSAFYLDVLKDRLYASGPDWPERRSAQTALHRLAETLARLLAPLLVHTTEEVWDYLKLPDKPESVHLAALPDLSGRDYGLTVPWDQILALRDTVQVALEEKRQSGEVRNSLEARVHLDVDADTYRALEPYRAELPALLLVSQIALAQTRLEAGVSVTVTPAEGIKCARCWLIKTDVGADPAHPELCARCARAVSDLERVPEKALAQ